jgi:hypothetical protein
MIAWSVSQRGERRRAEDENRVSPRSARKVNEEKRDGPLPVLFLPLPLCELCLCCVVVDGGCGWFCLSPPLYHLALALHSN